jgi:hypothetical protein
VWARAWPAQRVLWALIVTCCGRAHRVLDAWQRRTDPTARVRIHCMHAKEKRECALVGRPRIRVHIAVTRSEWVLERRFRASTPHTWKRSDHDHRRDPRSQRPIQRWRHVAPSR